jgi:hypothetical protein
LARIGSPTISSAASEEAVMVKRSDVRFEADGGGVMLEAGCLSPTAALPPGRRSQWRTAMRQLNLVAVMVRAEKMQ